MMAGLGCHNGYPACDIWWLSIALDMHAAMYVALTLSPCFNVQMRLHQWVLNLHSFRRMDSVTSVSMLPFQRWKHVLHNGDHSSVFLWRHNVHIATYRQNVSESWLYKWQLQEMCYLSYTSCLMLLSMPVKTNSQNWKKQGRRRVGGCPFWDKAPEQLPCRTLFNVTTSHAKHTLGAVHNQWHQRRDECWTYRNAQKSWTTWCWWAITIGLLGLCL